MGNQHPPLAAYNELPDESIDIEDNKLIDMTDEEIRNAVTEEMGKVPEGFMYQPPLNVESNEVDQEAIDDETQRLIKYRDVLKINRKVRNTLVPRNDTEQPPESKAA